MVNLIKHNHQKLVFIIKNLVFKFSTEPKELEIEYRFLKNNNFSNILDPKSKYAMCLIKPISFHKNYYVMNKLSGQMSHKTGEKTDYFLAGCFLRTFHQFQSQSGAGEVGFGDFTMEHLFADHKSKTIIAIDPGNSHKTFDSRKQDIPRFLYKTVSGVFDLGLKIELIKSFFEGYGPGIVIDGEFLTEINKRILKNYNKEVNENKSNIKEEIPSIYKKRTVHF